jgi:hypothetical protein
MKEEQLLPLEKKYIEVQYDAVTQGYLREYCAENGFDLSIKFDGSKQNPEDFDFHSTVWFTTTEHRLKNGTSPTNIMARAKNFALFGEKENILVLELDSEDLHALRELYGFAHDMEDMYPDYRPHITVCYNWTGGIPDVEIPKEPLTADRLNIKKQKS